MGAMRPDQEYNKNLDVKLRSVEITGYRGKSLLSPVIYSVSANVNVSLTDRMTFQVKVPYQAVQGNFGKTNGMSDLSLSVTRLMKSTSKGNLSVTLGTKIPTNSSDLSVSGSEFALDGSDFPMYYQTSLGSYDFIAGASWLNEKWLIATGVQMALTQNSNDFKWSDWTSYPDGEPKEQPVQYVKDYARATNLLRGTDIMLRIERSFRFTNYYFSLGLLPIYRITKDEIDTQDGMGRMKVDGTTGLALSALFGAGYDFNVKSGVKFVLGLKLTHREVNPDGLTRENVTNLSYVYRF